MPRDSFRTATGLYAAVALGSVVGGTTRWLVSQAIHGAFGHGLPWGTMFVNVTGSFLIGLYAALVAPEGRLLAGPHQRQFVMTGVCGGYTTFSIFSFETVTLAQSGRLEAALANVGLSVAGWLLAVWSGYQLGTRFNRLKGT